MKHVPNHQPDKICWEYNGAWGWGEFNLRLGKLPGRTAWCQGVQLGEKKAANQRLDLATNMVRGDAKREKHGFEHR